MNEEVQRLRRALEAAKGWPEDVDAMQAIQGACADPNLDLSTLVPALIERLKSVEDWSVSEAAKTLGVIGDSAAVGPLCAHFVSIRASRTRLPQKSAGEAWGENEAYAYAMVVNEEESVALDLVAALQALASPVALPALQHCVDDASESAPIREAVRRAIAASQGAAR